MCVCFFQHMPYSVYQVSSLDSSIQNLSEMTQPLTAKATERESSLPVDNKNYSDSSDDTHKNLGELTFDLLLSETSLCRTTKLNLELSESRKKYEFLRRIYDPQ